MSYQHIHTIRPPSEAVIELYTFTFSKRLIGYFYLRAMDKNKEMEQCPIPTIRPHGKAVICDITTFAWMDISY